MGNRELVGNGCFTSFFFRHQASQCLNVYCEGRQLVSPTKHCGQPSHEFAPKVSSGQDVAFSPPVPQVQVCWQQQWRGGGTQPGIEVRGNWTADFVVVVNQVLQTSDLKVCAQSSDTKQFWECTGPSIRSGSVEWQRGVAMGADRRWLHRQIVSCVWWE